MARTVRAKSQRIHASTFEFIDNDGGVLRQVRARRRAVQRAALGARRRRDRLAPCLSPEAIAIVVEEPGPCVHFVATVDDLRGVLRALPSGAVDGLRVIHLSAAPEHPDAADADSARTLTPRSDPLTGRRGYEYVLPEVYGRPTHWDYDSITATLRVFGYVYEPPLPDQGLIEFVLRLRVLSDLVKGVAHHQERVARLSRGRRMPHDLVATNRRARAQADGWIRGAVVPYLRRAHPDAAAHFDDWMLAHGGVALPLDMLETYDDDSAREGQISMGVFDAFDLLVRKVGAGASAATTRCGFAFWLHYDYLFDEALAALDRLLRDAPGDADALALQAHIYVHQRRPQEAIASMRELVARAPTHRQAWQALVWAYEESNAPDEARAARARLDALPRDA